LNILVTGGAGFVGSNLVHSLLADGHDVTVLDNLSEGDLANLKGCNPRIIVSDIRKIHHQVDPLEYDAVYHLACSKMIYSLKAPILDLQVNAEGTLRLLDHFRKLATSIVYTSTGSVYGNPLQYPTPETEPKYPESPYGVSKWMAEEYCKLYHKLYRADVKIARLHSVYGPRQTSIGVIPCFIQQSIEGKPMTVEGTGYQGRSFTYVDDCVDALKKIEADGSSGEVYNVASGKITNINRLSELVSEVTGKPLNTKKTERKKGDLDLTEPNVDKLRDLGWHPKISLKEGLRLTYNWITHG
jgi:UDP-glucose 4-epimerase